MAELPAARPAPASARDRPASSPAAPAAAWSSPAGCEMRCLQLLLGDPSRDRGRDPEPFHKASTTCATPSSNTASISISPARSTTGAPLRLAQNPPDARHQPLQHRPIEPVGTTEAVHHPGFDMALLRMARILGERVVAHHAAVLVPPLGRSQVHAHPDSMSRKPIRAETANSCAHMFCAETAAHRKQNHATSMTCRVGDGQIRPKYAQRPQTQVSQAPPLLLTEAVERSA
jgi:hypothetical protein